MLQIAAVANFAVALWIVRLLPQTFFRALFQWYFRLFHHAHVEGLENLPSPASGSILVINHLSFLDGCLVAAFLPGDLVFAIDTAQARRFWFLKYVLDLFPVDPSNPMAIKTMVKAVRDGRRLAIFPEGRITLTGALMKIYDGPGMIADKAEALIVPVRIDGLQFHKTSRMQGKLPLRWFPRVSLTVLPPVRPDGARRARGPGAPRGAWAGSCRTSWSMPRSARSASGTACSRPAGRARPVRQGPAGRRRYRSQ